MDQTLRPFHLAIPVDDLASSLSFYGDLLGCETGRSSDHWIDFNFFGHQLVVHLKDNTYEQEKITNPVDGHQIPIPHFGVVLTLEDWYQLESRLRAKSFPFEVEPYVRFKGQVGEQATMFFRDPSGNALEFKAFKDLSSLFSK